MRITNISTDRIVTIDEYLDLDLLQFRLKLRPGQATFVDDALAQRSKKLFSLQQEGVITMINTSADVTLEGENGGDPGDGDQGVVTITPIAETGYDENVPVRAVIVASPVPAMVKVTNQTSTTFDLEVLDAAGDPYVDLDVTVKYSFGTSSDRLY